MLAVPPGLVLLLLVLGACGASSGASERSLAGDVSASAPKAGEAQNRTGAVTGTGRAAVTPMNRQVISTGRMVLHAQDLGSARADVTRMVDSWGGLIADEQSSSDHRGRLVSSTLTVRLPSDRFDDAMSALADLGDVEHQSRSAEDVSTEVIDVHARIEAAERTIQQIERLLDRAQRLSDVIAIESDLARRQADLESLKQQQAWLQDQTSLSTITLEMTRPSATPAEPAHAHGFLAGLERGWHALEAATMVLMTVLGAVLPFGVLAALVGVPAWVVVRRRRHAPA